MLGGREEWFGYTPSGLSTKRFHKTDCTML
jgi:hypothetical protein